MRGLDRLRPYRSRVDITPLIIETTVSILAGFFLLVWGMVLFSNQFYQLSLMTRLRNVLFTVDRPDELYEGITVITPDLTETVSRRGAQDPHYLLGYVIQALDETSAYAASVAPRPVVTGVDFAISRTGYTDEQVEELARVLAALPENLSVVFGTVLLEEPGGGVVPATGAFFARLGEVGGAAWREAGTTRRIYFGHIGTLAATIRSGLDTGSERTAVVGYQPLIPEVSRLSVETQSGTRRSFFASLPLAMYLAGDGAAGDGELAAPVRPVSEFGAGRSGFSRQTLRLEHDGPPSVDALSLVGARTGLRADELLRPVYIDFRVGRGVEAFPNRNLWLRTREGLVLTSALGESPSAAETPSVEYFFIAPPLLPDYFGVENQDAILTVASTPSGFTGEYRHVSGVTAHATALFNLRNSTFIRRSSGLAWAVALLVTGAVALVSLRSSSLLRNALLVCAIVVLYAALVFAGFLFGYLVPWNLGFGALFAIFVMVVMARFVATMRLERRSDSLLAAAFAPEMIAELDTTETVEVSSDGREGVILVATVMAGTGEQSLPPSVYDVMLEEFRTTVREATFRNQGGSLVVAPDSVSGFWLESTFGIESLTRAHATVLGIFDTIDEVERRVGRRTETQVAPLAVCIAVHRGALTIGENERGLAYYPQGRDVAAVHDAARLGVRHGSRILALSTVAHSELQARGIQFPVPFAGSRMGEVRFDVFQMEEPV